MLLSRRKSAFQENGGSLAFLPKSTGPKYSKEVALRAERYNLLNDDIDYDNLFHEVGR